MLMVISCRGVATSWTVASGTVQARWLAALLCRTRAGTPQVHGPGRPETHPPQLTPPTDWMAPVPSCGIASPKPVITDSGLRGADWLTHWAEAYGAHVLPPPPAPARTARHGWSAARQVVETTCAHVTERCGRTYPGAHTSWGLRPRVAAKVAAYNLGIVLHRLFGRPDFAFATLIV